VTSKEYNHLCFKTSWLVIRNYSTSFSLGTSLFTPSVREAVAAIYGFVRFADEIVDTFGDCDRAALLAEFKAETLRAIDTRISVNPILQSFQITVNKYGIDREYILAFFRSMEMDLTRHVYSQAQYEEYIYGSAEVIGLMCLRVFCASDQEGFARLRDPARRLGAAFQKVNFLRDIKSDFEKRGRRYLPQASCFPPLALDTKLRVELEIAADFRAARPGIAALPGPAKLAVYSTYLYYFELFRRLQASAPEALLNKRIRVGNFHKILLLLRAGAEIFIRRI